MYLQLTTFKVCTVCRCTKPATPHFFYRDRGKKDGLQNKCKVCKGSDFQSWYAKPGNRKFMLLRQAEYLKAYVLTERGREVVRARDVRRRRRTAQAKGNCVAADLVQMYEDQDRLCAYCEVELDGSYEVDHMVPIARGGSNDWENLAITCSSCNRRKHAKTTLEFMLLL